LLIALESLGARVRHCSFGQRPFAQLAMLKFAGNMLYAQRHLVECCFSKLKQFRRVATVWVLTPQRRRCPPETSA
jgi:transposase